jgi:hypothetical protein
MAFTRRFFYFFLLFPLFASGQYVDVPRSPGKTASPVDETWQVVGQPGFSDHASLYPCIAINPKDGQAFVAYADAATSKGDVGYGVVKRFDGNQWVSLDMTGFSPGKIAHLSLSFSPVDSLPYLSFTGSCSNGEPASVMRYNGTSWEYVGGDWATEGLTYFNCLAFDPVSGQPWLAFTDGMQEDKLSVRRFDGSTWVNVGFPGFTAGQSWYVKLAFTSAGVPYVAYKDFANGQAISVMSFNGTEWNYIGAPGFTGIVGLEVGFDLGTLDDMPYVACSRGGSGQATVKKFSEGSWVDVGDPNLTLGFATGVSFVISPSGQPFFSFWDSSFPGMCLIKYEETGWEYVGGTGFTGTYIHGPSLALAPGDIPYLSYADEGNFSRITVMKYDFPTGLAETPVSSFRIFPNPASEYIQITSPHGISGVDMLDAQGRKVLSCHQPGESLKIDISSLSPGTYLVRVTTDSGFDTRVVVKR